MFTCIHGFIVLRLNKKSNVGNLKILSFIYWKYKLNEMN